LGSNEYDIFRNVYFESGMIFDDSPTIYGDPMSSTVDEIDVPMNDNTMEKHNLWNRREE